MFIRSFSAPACGVSPGSVLCRMYRHVFTLAPNPTNLAVHGLQRERRKYSSRVSCRQAKSREVRFCLPETATPLTLSLYRASASIEVANCHVLPRRSQAFQDRSHLAWLSVVAGLCRLCEHAFQWFCL